VGHSLGSLIALEMAARHPKRIAKLVLVATAVPMPVGDPLLNAARDRSHDAVDMVMQFGHAFSSHLGGNPVAGISIVNSRMRVLERNLPVNLFEDLNACHTYQGGLDAAIKIQCPVMLVLGDQDRMTPPQSTEALIAALRSPDVRMLKNCGHMPMSEQPEALHQALVAAVSGR
jgi:pimeloyl-ACP methyl ester carboxylesterase